MIKSEKAKADVELLQRQLTYCELNDVRFGVEDHKESRAYKIGKDIESYVIQAESDARKRAVRAFNESCPSYYIYWEIGMCDETGDEQHVQCQSVECEAREAFLRHYDNEQ